MSIGFIGAGRMAIAITKGFIDSGLVRATSIIASDHQPEMLEQFKTLGAKTTQCNKEVMERSRIVLLCVKPQVMSSVLREVSSFVTKETLLISIAAGVTLETIEEDLPSYARVVRVMPNTPALVNAGASVVSAGSNVEPQDTEVVAELFRSVGICDKAPESLLDAVTGVSGSGPAYIYAAIEAMADGGVRMGLPRDLAMKLAAQTMMGSAKMVLDTGKHPGQLKDEVCSPGGTTIAAMHSLEQNGFRASLIDAVVTSSLKAKELGQKSVASKQSVRRVKIQSVN